MKNGSALNFSKKKNDQMNEDEKEEENEPESDEDDDKLVIKEQTIRRLRELKDQIKSQERNGIHDKLLKHPNDKLLKRLLKRQTLEKQTPEKQTQKDKLRNYNLLKNKLHCENCEIETLGSTLELKKKHSVN